MKQALRTPLCVSAVPLLLIASMNFSAVDAAVLKKCDPNGLENERIGCIDLANKETVDELAKRYKVYLNSFVKQCSQQFSGGGSGGHLDRATCVSDRLKNEASRIGLAK